MSSLDDRWLAYYRKNCPTPFPVRIGIDEIATETQKCEGWTLFCLPERHVNEFNKDASAILGRSSLKAFHAKKFKEKHLSEYKEFLLCIKEYALKSPQVLAINSLISKATIESLRNSFNRILVGALTEAGLGVGDASKILSAYIPPLFTLARLADGLGPNIEMKLEMDEHSSFRALNTIIHEQKGIDAHAILRTIYNAYCQKQFPRTPLLQPSGLSVMKDSQSKLIQAADVIGNFSMAYVFTKIGKQSKSRELKASVIDEVFGGMLSGADFSKLTLENNDFTIKDDGYLTYKLCWELTARPDEEWLKAQGF